MLALRIQPITWREAFLFAHEEGMRAFDLLADGDIVGAEMLIESAKEANSLAAQLHASDL